MAERARLSPPETSPSGPWRWHSPDWLSLPVSEMISGERRLEAENFLSSGRALRIAFKGRQTGWCPISKLAAVWKPGRTKNTLVPPNHGTPFLAATQVFDFRPIPRKWVARGQHGTLLAKDGEIVVTCSGSVGNVTILGAPHSGALISNDLLRIVPHDRRHYGWVFGFLRSDQAKQMMTSAQYGHIIKHLEVQHLEDIPIPQVKPEIERYFLERTEAMLASRNRGHELTLQAEAYFEKCVGEINISDWGEKGYSISSGSLFGSGRRRLEGSFHNPGVTEIRRHLFSKHSFMPLSDLGYKIWVPGRYKRVPAVNGVDYFDSADVLTVCPTSKKRFADCAFGDSYRGRVKKDWLLMPSSGQVYGIIGNAVLAGELLDGKVLSNHVIRIAPTDTASIRPGYLLTALTHPTLGRPILKSLPFGSSVPEIDTGDLTQLDIVRLSLGEETTIADLAEEAASHRTRADLIEKEMASESGKIVAEFLSGSDEDVICSPVPLDR